MDEMTFRTKLMTHPHMLDEGMLEYLERNPEQKRLVQSARELDKKIANVLDVGIPEGLHARVLLKQACLEEQGAPSTASSDKVTAVAPFDAIKARKRSESKKVGWNLKWLYGVAASALVFTLGLNMWFTSQVPDRLTGEHFVNHVLHHVQDEPEHLHDVHLPSTESEINTLFARVGATLDQPVNGMTYAGVCDVEGHEGVHIVMQENDRPVTVIVIPGQELATTQAFDKSGYKGEIIPVKGGVVAIVADTMEQVALAQIRFFKSIRFV